MNERLCNTGYTTIFVIASEYIMYYTHKLYRYLYSRTVRAKCSMETSQVRFLSKRHAYQTMRDMRIKMAENALCLLCVCWFCKQRCNEIFVMVKTCVFFIPAGS